MDKLYDLFQGSAGKAGSAGPVSMDAEGPGVPGGSGGSAPTEDWIMPAGVLLQSRIINLFTKSLQAANHFPGTLQVSPYSPHECQLLHMQLNS